jgi:hypothetical protein
MLIRAAGESGVVSQLNSQAKGFVNRGQQDTSYFPQCRFEPANGMLCPKVASGWPTSDTIRKASLLRVARYTSKWITTRCAVTRQESSESPEIYVWRWPMRPHTPGSTAESTISGRVTATSVWPHWGENRIADSHIEIRPAARLRSFDSAEIPRPCVRCTSASLGSICVPGRPAFERAACLDMASGY